MLQLWSKAWAVCRSITKAVQEVQLAIIRCGDSLSKPLTAAEEEDVEAAWPVQAEIDSREALVPGSERKQLAQLREHRRRASASSGNKGELAKAWASATSDCC